MKVIAVIGDIVGSRAITPRAPFQRRLTAALARTRKSPGIASPYTVTLGDEFQVVYRAADALWLDLVSVLAAIHPVDVRFAIGVGELTTRLNPEQALGMDGPAFHRARDAMGALKKQRTRFRIEGAEPARWKLANHLLALLSTQMSGWSQVRFQILAGLLRRESVREFGPALRISKVAVYKNINAAALDEIAAICEELSRALNLELRES